jgi:glycosidase
MPGGIGSKRNGTRPGWSRWATTAGRRASHWRRTPGTYTASRPTPPILFWGWLIGEIQAVYPDVIFLAEAFTRPKVLQALAKPGFTQSYTYFTWRNFKSELIDHFTELTQTEVDEYFRGNLFSNTPDILPPILQQGGRPAFKVRLALAATLSTLYRIYSGYEFCENTAVPGTEEYLDSEKYEIRVRDTDAPGNIRHYIARMNAIRRENSALHEYWNLRFHDSDGDSILWYGKRRRDGANAILVAVNLDPFEPLPGSRADQRQATPLEGGGTDDPAGPAGGAGSHLPREPVPPQAVRNTLLLKPTTSNGSMRFPA